VCHSCNAPNMFRFEDFESEAQEYTCRYENFLNTVVSLMRKVKCSCTSSLK
jgi:hypothetical protein